MMKRDCKARHHGTCDVRRRGGFQGSEATPRKQPSSTDPPQTSPQPAASSQSAPLLGFGSVFARVLPLSCPVGDGKSRLCLRLRRMSWRPCQNSEAWRA